MPGKLKKRVLKRPEERQRDFIESARTLFLEKGYEKTSVDDLVGRTGTSKGAFYHHFKSKYDLLLELADQLVGDAILLVQDVVHDTSLSASQRLNRVLERLRSASLGADWPNSAITLLRLQRENGLLYERITESSYRMIGPILADIIAAGAAEGVFAPVDPPMTAELILRLDFARVIFAAKAIDLAKTGRLEEGVALLNDRSRTEEALLNRVLGAERDGLSLPDRAAINGLLSRITPSPAGG